MYFYINGKKVRPNYENKEADLEKHDNDYDEGNEKCPTYIFILLGIIATLIAIWLIYCIYKDKKKDVNK